MLSNFLCVFLSMLPGDKVVCAFTLTERVTLITQDEAADSSITDTQAKEVHNYNALILIKLQEGRGGWSLTRADLDN